MGNKLQTLPWLRGPVTDLALFRFPSSISYQSTPYYLLHSHNAGLLSIPVTSSLCLALTLTPACWNAPPPDLGRAPLYGTDLESDVTFSENLLVT